MLLLRGEDHWYSMWLMSIEVDVDCGAPRWVHISISPSFPGGVRCGDAGKTLMKCGVRGLACHPNFLLRAKLKPDSPRFGLLRPNHARGHTDTRTHGPVPENEHVCATKIFTLASCRIDPISSLFFPTARCGRTESSQTASTRHRPWANRDPMEPTADPLPCQGHAGAPDRASLGATQGPKGLRSRVHI